jgi:hypothetical protein
MEQHFFGTLSHVVVQRPGISDILAVYAKGRHGLTCDPAKSMDRHCCESLSMMYVYVS